MAGCKACSWLQGGHDSVYGHCHPRLSQVVAHLLVLDYSCSDQMGLQLIAAMQNVPNPCVASLATATSEAGFLGKDSEPLVLNSLLRQGA